MVLRFSWRFRLTASLRRRRMSVYIYLFRVSVSVKCINDLLEFIKSTMYTYVSKDAVCAHICSRVL